MERTLKEFIIILSDTSREMLYGSAINLDEDKLLVYDITGNNLIGLFPRERVMGALVNRVLETLPENR